MRGKAAPALTLSLPTSNPAPAPVFVADGSRPRPEDFTAGWDRADVVRALSDEATFLEQTLEVARTTLGQLAGLDRWLLWIDLATLLPPWQVPAEFSDPYFQEQE